MNATEATVEKALAGRDEHLEPAKEVEKKETTEVKEEPGEDQESPEKGKDDVDEGFTADEVEDHEELPDVSDAPTNSVETKEVDTSSLDPEAKYIVDNLPYIVARIKDGESVKEVHVKSWAQLPEDVTFASKRDELAFINALTAQENRAQEKQREFRSMQQQDQAKEFEQREATAIRDDIASLQKEGELPKFKVRADDPKFSEDPAAKEVQKVLNFMDERNEQYLKEYNQGRAYRRIGFREAYDMYVKQNPKKAAEVQEDEARKKTADKINPNRGLSPADLKKPTVRPGTTTRELLDRIEMGEF